MKTVRLTRTSIEDNGHELVEVYTVCKSIYERLTELAEGSTMYMKDGSDGDSKYAIAGTREENGTYYAEFAFYYDPQCELCEMPTEAEIEEMMGNYIKADVELAAGEPTKITWKGLGF